MSLTASYRKYLEGLDHLRRAEEMGLVLAAYGLDLESELLRAYAQGNDSKWIASPQWAGRRAHIGPELPMNAVAGEIWLDTCELMPMILLPREFEPGTPEHWRQRLSPFEGWLAIRPVGRWQFGAFLSMATFERVQVQIEPPFKWLDADRILSGPEASPVVNLTCGEAGAYADWVGKLLGSDTAWEAAPKVLNRAELQSLWVSGLSEWIGVSYFDEGVMVAINQATVGLDPQDQAESSTPPPSELRMIFGDWDHSSEIGLRTYIDPQVGIASGEIHPGDVCPVRLTSRLLRPPCA